MSRPEDLLPPDLYYNDVESAKYTSNSRIQSIQRDMTLRALELLDLQLPSFILDVGCGSGLSGEILSEEGHTWIGMDIAPSMLDIALQRQQERLQRSEEEENDHNEDEDEDDETDGDLFLADMGQGVPFRAGAFDAAISISAVQWLCNVESSHAGASAESRLRRFFDTLYASLRRGGKAVLQFYPKNETQRSMISSAAVRAGFGAGILEDDGGTKNVKTYLVLNVGGGDITGTVSKLDGVEVEDGRKLREAMKRKRGASVGGALGKGSKDWIMKKKEKMRSKGKVVKSDSKYTGRNRGPKF